jgi:hypothetical protein
VPSGAHNAGLLELPTVTLRSGARGRSVPDSLSPGLAARIDSRFASEHGLTIRARALRGRVAHAITRHAIDALVIDAAAEPLPRALPPWSWAGPDTLPEQAVTGMTRKIARLLASP